MKVIKNVGTSHPWWLRLTHWLNAYAVIVLILSGWQIYNASPIFDFRMPSGIAVGGWLGGALQWHFFAMWILFFNGIFYLLMNVITGRFKKKYWPMSLRELGLDVIQTLKLKLSHDDLSHYNMVQKLAYLFAIVALIVMVMSGMAIWKSVQFPLMRELMGGYDNARIIHFVCMSSLVLFIIVHVVMVILVPRTLKGMTFGKF